MSRWMDPGVLFVAAGSAVIGAGMLIPAADELAAAEHERDVARAVADWQAERLNRYAAYAGAAAEPDETMLRGMAAGQLNLAPAGSVAVGERVGDGDVFGAIEPAFVMPVASERGDSALGRMVRDGRSRLWLLAGGALLVLIGLVGTEPTRGSVRGSGTGIGAAAG